MAKDKGEFDNTLSSLSYDFDDFKHKVESDIVDATNDIIYTAKELCGDPSCLRIKPQNVKFQGRTIR